MGEGVVAVVRGVFSSLFLVFLLLFSGSSLVKKAWAILDPVDFLALQAVGKSLEDMPGSAFFAGWDFTGDPCGFPGVFCAGDRVVALALGDPRAGSPGLSGRLDPALGRLSALAELSLVPGRVVGSIPDSLSLCSDLRFLALSKNFLSGPIPDSLGSLRRLRTLDLSYNQLSGSIPPSLPSIPAMANLVLCHNRLSGSIPAFPDSAPLLRMDLKHNDLSGPVPALPSALRYLSLSSNRLAGRVDGVLPRLTRLSYLDLSMNQLEGPIPGCVFSFPLQSLQLQRNFFSGPVAPSAAPSEVAIPVVDLSYNRFWGPVPPQLAAVGRLYLNNNRFTGEVPGRLVQGLMGGMQLLYLQHNYLTGVEISPAAAIPVGASLCLQYNCMVPPVDAPCPLKAGTQKTRPTDQCPEWQG
ncbi:LRR receptor-like serine/threonine-protein kinase ER2 [Phoenix dactylifera]|uniref:LRR receptor-like serine/threonine-protein kinase ER2 n=1 Tax=Phoenix dactylifera TaxID=42345 RepID=A0A8B9ANQ8_PHODC|nr:LRR receptor-like serine/threonine-protein kinase ER2 [Phoenix dactylifera]